MSATKPSFYITTPIYYVNGAPHLGSAYTTLACDVLARFKRMDGFEVLFLTGTDEHGQKIQKAAETAAIDPQTFTDNVSQNFRDLCQLMNYSNDDFIRTTEERHKISAKALWQKLEQNGHIYLGSYAGWYAVRDEAFYGEDELTKAADGKMMASSGAVCEWVEEPSYFFKLSAFQQPLLDYFAAHPNAIQPDSRRNEVLRFIEGGLNDLSISRTSLTWGIPVPNAPEHVMYVWLDALANYLSAIDYPNTESVKFQAFWPANFHVVGKDILRFHAVYWPAFLMAANLAPATTVFAHGWWTSEGQKMSKSVGNIITPSDLVAEYGLDAVRYFLLREVPFGSDGDFSKAAMVQRLNGELANDLGNLVQRTLSFIIKNCDGTVAAVADSADYTAADLAYLALSEAALPKVRAAMDKLAFHTALEEIWAIIRAGNRYIDEQAPWTLRKTDLGRVNVVLYVLLCSFYQIGLLLLPFMPDTTAKLFDMLGIAADKRGYSDYATPAPFGEACKITELAQLFPRYEAKDDATEKS